MNAAKPDSELEQRLEALERRLAGTVAVISQNERRLRALEGLNRRTQPGPPSAKPSSPVRSEPRRVRTATTAHETSLPVGVMVVPGPPPRARRVKTPDPAALSDFLGGRALAWIGATATVLGICLLLALATSHVWIGREARVGLAAAGSAALMAAGVWLHARRGRTEAAVAMVGAATTGSFATMIVAGQVYQLIPPMVAVVGSMLVGAVATALAIRWAGRAVAVLGLIGALLSPVLAGAAADGMTIAMLAVAAACSVAVVLWRRWPWLAFAGVLVCAPQWLAWMAHGHTQLLNVAVLAVFGSIGLLGAVFAQLRSPKDDGLLRSATALALLNATIVGVAGRVVLGSTGAAVWLAALALVHAGLGLWRRPRIAIHDNLRRLLIAIGVVAADAALTLSIHGVVLSAAWGAAAIGFAWLARRVKLGAADEPWVGAGLGAHIGLLLTHALIGLPPSELATGPQLAPMASIAILAATCLGCARVTGSERVRWRITVDGLGLLAVGYLTAATPERPRAGGRVGA